MNADDGGGDEGRPPGEHRTGERRGGDRRKVDPTAESSGSRRVPGVAEAPIPGLGREAALPPRRLRGDRRIPTATASAAWAAGIYALAGLIWIYFSDAALLALSPSPELFALVQTWKGSLFVLATAVLLFFLLREQFRRRSQQASRISAADRRLRLQILNSPLALVEFDRQLVVRGWSPRAAELFGWSAEEVLGRRLDEIGLVHPADREATHQRVEKARRDRALGWIHANRNVRKDGSVVHCEWYNAWLRSPTGQEETMISLAQDVTWQQEVLREVRAMNRELEARVQRRTEDLAQANADLKSLTWSITHDLRAPVRAVSGFAGILQRRYAPGLPEEGRTYLSHILDAGAQMDRLIDALLDFGRIEAHGVAPLPVEASALAISLRARLLPILAEADLAGEPGASPLLSDPDEKLHIDPQIPPVRADPLLLERVLQNLVDNAVKHRTPGGPLRIRIQGETPTDTPAGRVRIRVEDDGPGIPPEHRRSLFSLFERLPSALEVQGSGVGLAVVRRAMERMDGQVWIEDARTLSGAAFVLDLPAADPAPDDPALHPPPEVPPLQEDTSPETTTA